MFFKPTLIPVENDIFYLTRRVNFWKNTKLFMILFNIGLRLLLL